MLGVEYDIFAILLADDLQAALVIGRMAGRSGGFHGSSPILLLKNFNQDRGLALFRPSTVHMAVASTAQLQRSRAGNTPCGNRTGPLRREPRAGHCDLRGSAAWQRKRRASAASPHAVQHNGVARVQRGKE